MSWQLHFRVCFSFCVAVSGVAFAFITHETINVLAALLLSCIGGWFFGKYVDELLVRRGGIRRD